MDFIHVNKPLNYRVVQVPFLQKITSLMKYITDETPHIDVSFENAMFTQLKVANCIKIQINTKGRIFFVYVKLRFWLSACLVM